MSTPPARARARRRSESLSTPPKRELEHAAAGTASILPKAAEGRQAPSGSAGERSAWPGRRRRLRRQASGAWARLSVSPPSLASERPPPARLPPSSPGRACLGTPAADEESARGEKGVRGVPACLCACESGCVGQVSRGRLRPGPRLAAQKTTNTSEINSCGAGFARTASTWTSPT